MHAIWKVTAGYGIAYVENREVALGLLRAGVVLGRTLDEAMAIYLTPGGRAFAWQLLFPYDRREAVAGALGAGQDGSPDAPADLAPEPPEPRHRRRPSSGATEPPLRPAHRTRSAAEQPAGRKAPGKTRATAVEQPGPAPAPPQLPATSTHRTRRRA